MNMRVLIADRNARLLESISRTFAHQFSIQTATTHEHCNDLLVQGEFDLAIISEKLADGPGLRLLGQIARNSPDTLRVFAARQSRLQLLKGKLGPFGLFRTLAYPIDPQKLLSALTLARAGLEIDAPAPKTPIVPVVKQQAGKAPARRGNAAPPLQAQKAGASMPAPPAVRPTVARISLTSADAMFAVNVPTAIASMERVRRPNLSSAPRPVPAARGVAPQPVQAQQPAPQSMVSQAAAVPAAPRLSPQNEAFQATSASRKAANRGSRVVSRSSVRGRVHRAPMRTKLALGATVAVVFLVTLTLNLVDTGVHVTHAAPRPQIAKPDISAPPRNSTPVDSMPVFRPAPSVAQRVAPRLDATTPDVGRVDPQIAASTAPVADPSTFSSEAYEPIYSD